MKDQRARDEQSVTIATALTVFLVAVGACIVVLLFVGWVTDMEQIFETGFPWAVVAAALAGALYLVRHRR